MTDIRTESTTKPKRLDKSAVTTNTGRSLKDIEADIIGAIPELVTSVTEAADRMRRIGELLLEGKNQLPHGEFTTWVGTKFPFTDRHARNLMRLAQNWATVQPQLADRKHVSVFRLMTVHDIDGTSMWERAN